MAFGYDTVSVTDSATLIMASRPGRNVLVVYNNGETTVFVGMDENVTTSNGIPILPQSSYTQTGQRVWMGPVYGIVGSGTSDVRFWDAGQ